MTTEQISAILETKVEIPSDYRRKYASQITDEAREFAYLLNACVPDGHAKLNALGKLQESLHIALAAIAANGA